MSDPLATLRAEVERLRDEALVKSRNMDGAAEHIGDAMREQSRAYARAYARTRMTLDDIPPGI